MRHYPILVGIGVVVISQLIIGYVIIRIIHIFADIDVFIIILAAILLLVFVRFEFFL